MTENFTELAFTESVKAQQEKYGSRAAYSRMEQGGAFRNQLTWQEQSHIEDRDGFYLASVGTNGWPYMQFRGGPKGFLKVIDDDTLAYADFRGNGQYISTGNFLDNKKTMLFLMDYPNKRRLKIWAEAEVLDIEEAWKIVDPLIHVWEQHDPSPMPEYAPGSWGPKEADALLAQDGRTWQRACVDH